MTDTTLANRAARREHVLVRSEQRASLTEIARELGVSKQRVSQLRHSLGLLGKVAGNGGGQPGWSRRPRPVVTPAGWWSSLAQAARMHGLSRHEAERLIRSGERGWRYAKRLVRSGRRGWRYAEGEP